MMANKRLGLVIDLDRCIGCWTCATACKAENGVALGNWWNRILNVEGAATGSPGMVAGEVKMTNLPVQCMHCENAPCVKACPVGATYKREDGIVMQDYNKCIGCRMCMAACPYGAKVFNWGEPQTGVSLAGVKLGNPAVPERPRHVAEKCTFCVERVDQGELPACVAACPALTRTFGDLNDPNSEVSILIRERNGSQLLPEFGTDPNIYYLPARRHHPIVEKTPSYGG
ncbi:MAG: 4Fe-4S dicluster domain-containing protein [Anaerolineales bacterium]